MDHTFQIFHITFVILLIRGLAVDIPAKWIQKYLWEKDTLKHKVKLRPYGIVSHCVDMSIFTGVLIVSIVLKQATFAALFSLVIVGQALYLVDVYSKRVRYTKRNIFIKKLRKERVISVSEITQICWESPDRGIGFILVIYVIDGSKFSFSQEEYIGLRELAKIKSSK